MSHAPTDNDLIERYLLGKLTGEESRTFQVRLEKDREFARKFRLISTFPEMMSESGRMEFENKQAEIIAGVVKTNSLRLRNRRYITWAIISVISLIGAAFFFIFSTTVHREEQSLHKENIAGKEHIVKAVITPVRDTLPRKTKQLQSKEENEKSETGSGSIRKAIGLVSPADGMNFSRKEMIIFNWTMKTDSFTRFYIYSETHDKLMLWRGIKPGIREYKIPGNYLYPGKFYWFVGKKEQKRSFVINE